MIGAIVGDIIGSVYEFHNTNSLEFQLFVPSSTFTDDTVMTVAVADCILHGKDYAQTMKRYGREYPGRGYGGMFRKWLASSTSEPYNSFGNGSAMRVSPVGFAFSSIDKVLEEARRSAEITHNHPEGIKGAQGVAAAVFLAKHGRCKTEIMKYVSDHFDYNLEQTLDEIRPHYSFNETCQGSVPQAIIAFLESENYEDAIRKAISLGGDSDTIACITGGIAEAFYRDIPETIVAETRKRLDPRLLKVVDEFESTYGNEKPDPRG